MVLSAAVGALPSLVVTTFAECARPIFDERDPLVRKAHRRLTCQDAITHVAGHLLQASGIVLGAVGTATCGWPYLVLTQSVSIGSSLVGSYLTSREDAAIRDFLNSKEATEIRERKIQRREEARKKAEKLAEEKARRQEIAELKAIVNHSQWVITKANQRLRQLGALEAPKEAPKPEVVAPVVAPKEQVKKRFVGRELRMLSR